LNSKKIPWARGWKDGPPQAEGGHRDATDPEYESETNTFVIFNVFFRGLLKNSSLYVGQGAKLQKSTRLMLFSLTRELQSQMGHTSHQYLF
jgi:hypothetical protein